ncbi:DNA polymerase subunit gamma-2, mitochondrial isoform X2 [Hermetia illucens]|uniref:DNA polymerase subunit gamma-2, mitochondrial isoform X2 n=1 Tax=Hermetia illucens TaxID=343691 RepID=UPI0018CC6795|nr:DNA polymerase subunit gamma-2, mitochondrial isoform X2 [Hermetia illucens]
MRKLSEILSILKESGYIDVQLINQALVNKITFLPLGSVLLDKIRSECHSNRGGINTYNTNNQNGETIDLFQHRAEPNSLYKSKSFRENILHIKNQFQTDIPLAISENLKFSNHLGPNSDTFSVNLQNGTLISCSYFVNESAATEYFHRIQRERKIWWMKFSLNPGRYFLSDLSTQELNNYKVQTVKIKSRFNFGEMDLESVDVVPLRALELDNLEDFYFKDARLKRRILPAVVRSELCLEAAVLGILMDSVEDSRDKKININRKIAPYQCSVFCFSKELEDLAAHLTNVIRRSGLTALNLQKCRTNSDQILVRELKDMDQVGIPYSIILENESLRTGVMKLRSRDTGLSETIHITDVPDYLLKIFNS